MNLRSEMLGAKVICPEGNYSLDAPNVQPDRRENFKDGHLRQ